jgi:hypothetical protein
MTETYEEDICEPLPICLGEHSKKSAKKKSRNTNPSGVPTYRSNFDLNSVKSIDLTNSTHSLSTIRTPTMTLDLQPKEEQKVEAKEPDIIFVSDANNNNPTLHRSQTTSSLDHHPMQKDL